MHHLRPLPPAPVLPDAGEVIRKAIEEGIEQGLALARKDLEEERAKREFERKKNCSHEAGRRVRFVVLDGEVGHGERAPERVSLVRDDEIRHEFHPSERPIVERDDGPGPSSSAARPTSNTLFYGPYAGLQSAKKRVRETETETVVGSLAPQSGVGPAKKPAKTETEKGLKNVQVINSRAMKEGPEWYDSVDPKQLYSRGDLQDLKFLSTLVLVAKNNAAVGMDLTQSFFQIRKRIQAMEFYTSLSPILVKKSGLLEDKGLPLIFKNRAQGVDFPSDIRADADMLFRKWMSGQIDPHLLRGIVTKKFGESTLETGIKSYSFEQGFSGRVSCNYIGVGNLVNGQWWPFQICAKRDGAHGYHEAGIHGQKDKGAYSIVMGGRGYANVDNGNSIEYCGTHGTEISPSVWTSLMLKAYETQNPIRVLRSASLPVSNIYRPARGLRYDGVYRITSHEIIDAGRSMYRFSLLRVSGQDPIRYEGEGQIPSNAQILELNKIRQQIG